MISVLIAALLGLGLCVAVVAAEKRRRRLVGVGVGATGDDHAAASAGLSQGTVQGTQWHAQTAASSGKYASCLCVCLCRRIESAAAAVRACLSLPAGFLPPSLPPSASSWKPSQAKHHHHPLSFRVHSPFYETACFFPRAAAHTLWSSRINLSREVLNRSTKKNSILTKYGPNQNLCKCMSCVLVNLEHHQQYIQSLFYLRI